MSYVKRDYWVLGYAVDDARPLPPTSRAVVLTEDKRTLSVKPATRSVRVHADNRVVMDVAAIMGKLANRIAVIGEDNRIGKVKRRP